MRSSSAATLASTPCCPRIGVVGTGQCHEARDAFAWGQVAAARLELISRLSHGVACLADHRREIKATTRGPVVDCVVASVGGYRRRGAGGLDGRFVTTGGGQCICDAVGIVDHLDAVSTPCRELE